jgi:hypothetical protein
MIGRVGCSWLLSDLYIGGYELFALAHQLSHVTLNSGTQTILAAKLIVSARTAALKKNETIACNVTRRLNSFELMETSDVCDVAPTEVAK